MSSDPKFSTGPDGKFDWRRFLNALAQFFATKNYFFPTVWDDIAVVLGELNEDFNTKNWSPQYALYMIAEKTLAKLRNDYPDLKDCPITLPEMSADEVAPGPEFALGNIGTMVGQMEKTGAEAKNIVSMVENAATVLSYDDESHASKQVAAAAPAPSSEDIAAIVKKLLAELPPPPPPKPAPKTKSVTTVTTSTDKSGTTTTTVTTTTTSGGEEEDDES